MNLSTVTKDALKRTGRGGLQLTVTQGIIRLIMIVPNPDLMIDPNDYALLTIIIGGAVTVVHNVVENLTGKAIWKNVPEEPLAAE